MSIRGAELYGANKYANILLSLVLCGTDVISPNFVLMCANSLCFAISALSLSFLIGGMVSTRGAQNAIANVLSLGMSFTSGVFVPQQYLSSSLLNVAHFLPSY
jgi:ABC-2 type transport system permease protein